MSEAFVPPIHGPDHGPGGPDPIPGGFGIYAIEVYAPDKIVEVGDDQFEFEVPEDLDGATLVKVDGYVNTPSSSGSVQVQIAKMDDPGGGGFSDVLTSKIVIEAGEYNAKQAASPPVVATTSVADVVWGDHFRIDVDAAGVDTMGLGVILYFFPEYLRNVTLQGAKGDPGGITSFQGQWSGSGTYVVGDSVSNGGSSYVATVNNPTTEPGVDVGWEAEWQLLAGAQQISELVLTINGNGYVIDTGTKARLPVYFDCTIVEATLLADLAGSAVVDIWKDTYGAYPPTDADSITSSTPPTLSGANKTTDVALTGWTTAIVAGDVLMFNVDSCTLITQLTLSLKVVRT